MAGTTIQLCGRYVVELEGQRVETRIPGRQGRLLVAYLALNRDQPVTRSELVGVVWARTLPNDPADALAAVLSKVRAALGAKLIDGRHELRLVLPPDGSVDVEKAFAALHEAESACSQRDWPRAWSAALAAQLVARRRLLGGLQAEWIDEWRRRLDELLLRSRECYATACLGLGGTELAGAERAARLAVQSAPLRETASALLMQALERQGNAAEALVVYDALRHRLREELGTAPAEPLQAVYRRLLGGPDTG